MRLKCRLLWDPYLREVLLLSLNVALCVTGHGSRDVKAVNTWGKGVSLAIVKGVTKKNEIKLEK